MKLKYSKLSQAKQKKLLDFFVAGVTARTAANIIQINRNTACNFYTKLRQIIVKNSHDVDIIFDGEIEVDESYFGGHRKGKRGRGAGGKVPVFGILKRGDKVYTQVICDSSAKTLLPIINHKVQPDSIVYSDNWAGYKSLDSNG